MNLKVPDSLILQDDFGYSKTEVQNQEGRTASSNAVINLLFA